MTQNEPMEARLPEPTRKARSGPARCRKMAARLALLACTLTVTLLLLEAATRLLTETTPPLLERDPLVGQRFIRSFAGRVYDEESRRKVWLRFNRDGLRGPDRPLAKPPGVRRLAILGDSMIAGTGVEEEHTLAGQLEKLLNRSSGPIRWEVLNCGVSGASTGQELVLYREVVSHYSPDIVLCAFFMGNDLSDNSIRLSSKPRIYFDIDCSGNLIQLPHSTQRAVCSRWLNRHSRFYVWQKRATNALCHHASAAAGAVSSSPRAFCTRENVDVAHAWQLTAALLAAFQREVEGRGARFAVVLVPTGLQICENSFQTVAAGEGEMASHLDREHPNERLAEICDQAGIPLCTLTDDFRRAAPTADSRAVEERLFLNGIGHFNERGGYIAARSIHRFLTARDPQRVADVPLAKTAR